jgi:hypothetical protein
MSPGPEAYDLNGNRAKSCGISVPSLFFREGKAVVWARPWPKLANDVEPARFFPTLTKSGILSGNALKITVDESRYSTSYVWQVRIEATDADYCSIDAGGGLQEGLVGRGRRCVISATLQNYF